MGDVNGVGPEIIARAFSHASLFDACAPIVFGSAAVLEAVRLIVPGSLPHSVVSSPAEIGDVPSNVIPVYEGGVTCPTYAPGVLDADVGRAAMTWFEQAIDFAMAGEIDGIVTCPIHKEGIHRAGCDVQGHTDFIARRTGTASYRMCIFTERLRVIHLSEHVALAKALGLITKDRIVETIRMTNDLLVRLNTPERRIAVAGLNPHAGEAGAFGREEIETIGPALEAARGEGIDCTGPHSPDSVFRQALEGAYDAVIAMYHDQGHIPMKLVAMDEGVNVTLGLPIVRTSVDHGTAYDIAGKNLAREDSLLAAIRIAGQLAGSREGVSH